MIRFWRGRTNRKREIEVPVRREESTSEEVIGGAAFLLGRGIFANCAIKHCQSFERYNGIDSKDISESKPYSQKMMTNKRNQHRFKV